MKIIINESSEKRLIKKLIQEEIGGWSDKVNIVKDFLDKNFLKATNSTFGEDGRPKLHDIVIWVDKFKQPKQYMNDTDLFYLLQDQFKNILPPDEVQDSVNDIMDDAYDEAEKEIKKVTHNNRDKFLKQCIKDWYYNKISKNGSLSLYEDRMSNFGRNSNVVVKGDMKSNLTDVIRLAQTKEGVEMKFQDWDDTSINGHNIIMDINRELSYFNKKKSHGGLSKNILICDRTAGLNSPDLYMIVKMIYSSRAAFKWCIMCEKLAQGLDTETLNKIKFEISAPQIMNGKTYYFKSKEERDMCLPFLTKALVSKQAVFIKSPLKQEIESASMMTQELNQKVEEFLNTIFEPITIEHGVDINQINDLDDI